MAEALRVDPDQLLFAARAQTDVSTFVADMGIGQSMTNAATGMSSLHTQGACRAAGAVFDTAAETVCDELTTHSANLATAAGRYRSTDEELGRRLDQRMK